MKASSHVVHRGAVEFMNIEKFKWGHAAMFKEPVPDSMKAEFATFISPSLTRNLLKSDQEGFIIYPEAVEAQPTMESEQILEASKEPEKLAESLPQDNSTVNISEKVKEARKIFESLLQDAFTRRLLSVYSYVCVQKKSLRSGHIPDLLLYPLNKTSPVTLIEFKRPEVSIDSAEVIDQYVAYAAELAAKFPDITRLSIIYTNGWDIRFGLVVRETPSQFKIIVVEEVFSLYK